MNLKKIASIAFIAASCAMAFQPAAADTLDDVKAAGKLRVAIDLGLPPFGMLDQNQQPTGSDIDAAKLLAKDLGVELEVVRTTTPNRIPFLLTNKADVIISTLSITEERMKVIDFSKPYSVLAQAVAAPQSAQIKDYADLKGQKVATVRGAQGDAILSANTKDAQIMKFDDDATAVTAVLSGQADILANSTAVIQQLKDKAPDRNFETKFLMKNYALGVGLRKNNPKFKAFLDEWAQKNFQNGQLNTIYKGYLHVDLPADLMEMAPAK
ncbi:transporter substrate-binding domain-containing protein [Castellaniella sp. GW247-6E4]|uniref:transporter substrate-binding domain-containing protein n=1 Tax=Castellaniella sp. GW247-6E4 TaxID=3140380 RepID=UPI003314B973